jgi:polyhydroxyalkanoate synthesis regulator protein
MQIIRKYKNRKLYDPQQHGYISLPDLLKFPMGTFKVVTYKDEDVTTDTLLSGLISEEVNFETKIQVMEYCIDSLARGM